MRIVELSSNSKGTIIVSYFEKLRKRNMHIQALNSYRKENRMEKVEMLTPADIAPILGVDPQSIRLQAKDDPKKLGFPVVVIGSRTMIPKKLFFEFFKLKEE